MATIARTARFSAVKSYENSIDSYVPEPFPVDAVHEYRLEQKALQNLDTPADESSFIIDGAKNGEVQQEGSSQDKTFHADQQMQVS